MSDPTVTEPAVSVPGSDGSKRRWWMVLLGGLWATGVVGWLLVLPLVIAEMLVRQLAGDALNAPWTPYGTDEEGKTQLSVLIVVVIGGSLLLAAVGISRAARRRLGIHGGPAAVYRLASFVILLTPFLLARTGAVSLKAMVGHGWLW